MLHGRERELQTLRARMAGAREGRSFAMVVTGEAGIGKTSLLHAVLDAGLLEIVRPLLDLADALPAQQSAALHSAPALAPPAEHSRFAVPVAVLALLGAAAEDGPVLVVVDDAHWLDAATREALLFAARRLHAEGVGVLLGVRTGTGAADPDFAGWRSSRSAASTRPTRKRCSTGWSPRRWPRPSWRRPAATRWRCSSCPRPQRGGAPRAAADLDAAAGGRHGRADCSAHASRHCPSARGGRSAPRPQRRTRGSTSSRSPPRPSGCSEVASGPAT